MSDTINANSDDADLRAGHPPALRVGNKRVSRKSQSSGSRDDGEAHDPAPVDPSTGAFVPHNAQRLVAPQATQDALLKDGTYAATESAKKIHDKPQPTREKPHNNVHQQKMMVIQQPK